MSEKTMKTRTLKMSKDGHTYTSFGLKVGDMVYVSQVHRGINRPFMHGKREVIKIGRKYIYVQVHDFGDPLKFDVENGSEFYDIGGSNWDMWWSVKDYNEWIKRCVLIQKLTGDIKQLTTHQLATIEGWLNE